jgi:hypothetical protein
MKQTKRKERKIKCWNCGHALERVVYQEGKPKEICPKCSASYPEKPLKEAALHKLQDEYLITRDNKVLNKMMYYIQEIAYNQICSKLKSSGKFLNEEDIKDKVQWTLLKMTTKYREPDFRISVSFVEYMSQVVLYPLYNYKTKEREQKEISLYTPIYKRGSNDKRDFTLYDKIKELPYLDNTNDVENFFYKNIQKENIVNLLKDYIEEVVTISCKLQGYLHTLKLMILFDHYVSSTKPSKFYSYWWDKEGLELRDHFEKALFILRNSLRNVSTM